MNLKNVLWLRLGDNSEYHQYGNDLDAVASVLAEADIGENITQCDGGLNSSNYMGWNYISLYWGDRDSNLDRNLSKGEFKSLMASLEAQK